MNPEDTMLEVDRILLKHNGNWTRHNIIEMFKLIELREITRILYNKLEALQ